MKTIKYFLFCLLFFANSIPIFAHDIVKDLDEMTTKDAIFEYLQIGFQHIIPLGFDHILFILSLFILNPTIKPILWQSLAFTIAHSITLGLAMFGVFSPSPNLIEPLISLSIIYVAIENLFAINVKQSRLLVVFLFGLVHGLGFAGALGELGLPESNFLGALVMFNIGVELGQITLIILAFSIVKILVMNKINYKKWVLNPVSIAIALVAAYWTFERVAL